MIKINRTIASHFLLFFWATSIPMAVAADNYELLHDTSVILDDQARSASPPLPSDLDTIKSRPLFSMSRRPTVDARGIEATTLLIDGNLKNVELVGIIESTNSNTAGFLFEGRDTIWLQQDDYLGEWRVSEISTGSVQLGKNEEMMLLYLRKASGKTMP